MYSNASAPGGKPFRIDELCPQQRQSPFVGLGMLRVEIIAGAEAQHGVTEEFKALIVLNVSVLVRIARMGQRLQ